MQLWVVTNFQFIVIQLDKCIYKQTLELIERGWNTFRFIFFPFNQSEMSF